jgi:hypothetical protein
MSGYLHAPIALPPGKAPSAYKLGSWVGPKAGLDAVEKKNFQPRRESNPRPPIVQLVAKEK